MVFAKISRPALQAWPGMEQLVLQFPASQVHIGTELPVPLHSAIVQLALIGQEPLVLPSQINALLALSGMEIIAPQIQLNAHQELFGMELLVRHSNVSVHMGWALSMVNAYPLEITAQLVPTTVDRPACLIPLAQMAEPGVTNTLNVYVLKIPSGMAKRVSLAEMDKFILEVKDAAAQPELTIMAISVSAFQAHNVNQSQIHNGMDLNVPAFLGILSKARLAFVTA
jgi:hypothetical protein